MQHLGAFYESIDPAAALVNLAAVADDQLTTTGDDLRVPNDLPFLIGESALLEATAPLQAQVSSPSLRRVANIDIEPFGTGLAFSDLHSVAYHPMMAVPLVGDESLNFKINSNPGAATSQYGLVWLGDGVQQPVTGEIVTVRITAAVTNVLGSWESGPLTFGQDLPVGNYDVVGMRVVEATSVAARLVFKGGIWRPGVAVANSVTEPDMHDLRYGASGILGSFHTNNPPALEVLGAAGAVTPVVYLDLIPRG